MLKNDLQAIKQLIDNFKFPKCSFVEEDENGVVFLKDSNGNPIIMMCREDWDSFQKWIKEDESTII